MIVEGQPDLIVDATGNQDDPHMLNIPTRQRYRKG